MKKGTWEIMANEQKDEMVKIDDIRHLRVGESTYKKVSYLAENGRFSVVVDKDKKLPAIGEFIGLSDLRNDSYVHISPQGVAVKWNKEKGNYRVDHGSNPASQFINSLKNSEINTKKPRDFFEIKVGDYVVVDDYMGIYAGKEGFVVDGLSKEETKAVGMDGQLTCIMFRDGTFADLNYGYQVYENNNISEEERNLLSEYYVRHKDAKIYDSEKAVLNMEEMGEEQLGIFMANPNRPSMDLMEMFNHAVDDGELGLFSCTKSEDNKMIFIRNLLEHTDDVMAMNSIVAEEKVAEFSYDKQFSIPVTIDRTSLEMKAELHITMENSDGKTANTGVYLIELTAQEKDIIQVLVEQQIEAPLKLNGFDEKENTKPAFDVAKEAMKRSVAPQISRQTMELPDFDYEDLTDKMVDLSIFLGSQSYRFDMDVQSIADNITDLIQPLADGMFDCKDMKSAVVQMDMLVKIMDNKGFLQYQDDGFDWMKPALEQLSGYTQSMKANDEHKHGFKRGLDKTADKKKETAKAEKGEDR